MSAYVFARDAEGKPTKFACAVEIGKIDGKRVRKVVYGRTEKEAERKAARLVEAARQGVDLQNDRRTVAELLSRVLKYLKPRLTPGSYESYRRILEGLIVPELGAYRVMWLKAEPIDEFFATLLQTVNPLTKRRYAPGYVAKVRAVFRRALNQGMRWGYVASNVVALTEPIKQRRKKPRALSDEHIRKLLEVVKGHRFEPIYHVLVKLGMRRGEVLAIRWSDLNLAEGFLIVTGTLLREVRDVEDDGPKTALRRKDSTKSEDGDDRVLVLPPSLIPILYAVRQQQELERKLVRKQGLTWPDHDLVFTTSRGTPLDGRNLTRHFKTHAIPAACLPTTARLHDLRHTNISAMISSDIDPETARVRAGHSDVRVTLGIYTHTNFPLQRAAAAAIDSRFHVQVEDDAEG